MILPREHETPFNKAPVIRAVAALLMVIAILSAVTRIVTRLLTVGAFKKDDQLVAAATVVVIAQSAAVISQGANGLGKLESLGPEQVSYILKVGENGMMNRYDPTVCWTLSMPPNLDDDGMTNVVNS
jgi:hypothetical protein